MPAFGRGDDDSALVLQPKRGQRLGFGLSLCRLLDDPPLGVEPVELGGDARGFRDVAFEQQPHAEIGATDAAAGIDARPQHEAEMPGFRRPVQPRHVHQRGVADMVAPAHRDQPLGDEGTVERDQGRDVGDRAERDVMQHAEQVGLRHLGRPEAAPAQFAIDRDQRHERQPDGGEIAEAGEIVEPVRIDQRIDLREGRRRIGGDRSRPRTCRACALPPAARGWWCRNRPSPAGSRPWRPARAPLRRWGRSLRRCGPGMWISGSSPQWRRCQASSADEVAPSTS